MFSSILFYVMWVFDALLVHAQGRKTGFISSQLKNLGRSATYPFFDFKADYDGAMRVFFILGLMVPAILFCVMLAICTVRNGVQL